MHILERTSFWSSFSTDLPEPTQLWQMLHFSLECTGKHDIGTRNLKEPSAMAWSVSVFDHSTVFGKPEWAACE